MSGGSTGQLLEWIALRRVAGGRLIQLPAGRYLQDGRPLPGYVTDVLPGLLAAGLLVLGPRDPVSRQRRVGLTECGRARYEALRDDRRSDDAHPLG